MKREFVLPTASDRRGVRFVRRALGAPKLCVLTLALSLVALLSAAGIAYAQPALVMKDARVSVPGGGAHFFWTIAASPTNPEHLVACPLRLNPGTAHAIQAVVYGSTDGGESWRTLKAASEFPTNSEIWCAMSGDNTIYFSLSVGPSVPQELSRKAGLMYLWRSPDFGKTWTLSPHIPYSDAAILFVKQNASGRDRVFDLADSNGSFEERFLTIFDNDATVIRKLRTWNPVPPVPDDKLHCGRPPKAGTQLSDTALLPARPGVCINGVTVMGVTSLGQDLLGALFIDWTLNKPQEEHITFSRITADGRPLGVPSVVASLSKHMNEMRPLNDDFLLSVEPALASGRVPGSKRNRVYVTWQQIANGRVHVMLTASDDQGLSWSAPRAIDDAARRSNAGVDARPVDPSLAVNKDGVLAVTWAEFSTKCWRIALSEDGGKHFGASAPLNPCDRNITLSLGEALAGHVFLLSKGSLLFNTREQGSLPGGVFGVNDFRKYFEWLLRGTSLTAAQDGSFYALWSSMKSRDDELHVTHVSLKGQDSAVATQRKNIIARATCCLKNPDSQGHVELYYTSYDYDPTTHEFEIGAVLARKRGFGGDWPLVVRVKKISSFLGPMHASNADNELQGSGAAWVFDGPGTELPVSSGAGEIAILPFSQYEYSKPRTLRFRVEENLRAFQWPNLPKNAPGFQNAEYVNVDVDLLSSH